MATDCDRIDAYLPLRSVEFHILLSLAAGERHGYGEIQDIESRDAASPIAAFVWQRPKRSGSMRLHVLPGSAVSSTRRRHDA
jgi:hypothetical protein